MAEQDRIINNFVKKPPAEKPLTKMMPPKRVTANIMAPQASPTFKPFLLRRFAAVKPAEKHPAQRAADAITVNTPSVKSTTVAIAEKNVTIRKTAPTQASPVFKISMSFSVFSRSAVVLRRI